MSISNFVSGKMAFAGLLAAAALSVAVPTWASTYTTVTWQFYSSPEGALGTSQTYLGAENPTGSLNPPLSNDLSITAYGTIIGSYNSGNQSYSSTDLYNKDWTGTPSEQGLGLLHGPENEIGGNGMVQLNISNLLTLLGYANNTSATLSIGSISSSSSDVAVFTASNNLGDLGNVVATPLSYQSGALQSQSVTLADLKQQDGQYYQYLNISAQTSGESVLLSTLALTLPSNSGNPAPAPVPATAGLVLAGALGMGMLLLKRRPRML